METSRSNARLRTQWAAIGAAVAVTLGAGGIGGYNLVNAEISSGDKAAFVPITPCRITDTRPAQAIGGRITPLGPDESLTVDVQPTIGPCAFQIPPEATSVGLNITTVQATEQTFLTVHPAGTPLPDTSTINPAPGPTPTVNAATTGIDSRGQFNIVNKFGTVHTIIDINGYYEDHNHDDRYTPQPDQIIVASTDFASDAAIHKWTFAPALVHAASASEQCVSATVDLPAGREITNVSIRYSGFSGGSFAAGLAGITTAAGEYASASDVITEIAQGDPLTYPAPASHNDVGALSVPLGPDSPIIDGNDHHTLQVCTDDTVAVVAVVIELS